MKRLLILALSLSASLSFLACGTASPQPTDYSLSEHWLSIPATLLPVDIFYLYPTAFQNNNPNPQICNIDDASMMQGAAQAFERQATAFETVGNIYAPYYRQDNMSAINREEIIAGIPTMDAIAAFDYYVKHFNNGRPYILVSHSQGSDVMSNLLATYMSQNPGVYRKMIAAYVIGFSITPQYLMANAHLKFAQNADDTGVIVSYNTEAPDVVPGSNPVLSGVGLVINPITWQRDETLATKSQGLGSFLPDLQTKSFAPAPQYCDAKIDAKNGVLICSTANEDEINSLSKLIGSKLPRGVYHSFDYPFYYYNLRANAANRVAKFPTN